LIDGVTWLKKTTTAPLRGFENDADTVPEAHRRTAEQKAAQTGACVGPNSQLLPCNFPEYYCQKLDIFEHYLARNSGNSFWISVHRLSYFLDFNNIHLETDARPEDLYQRLVSFIDDNLLKANGGIRQHCEYVTADEDISSTMENIIVLTWLHLIHLSLPALAKQRSLTVASLKPEISQALDSFLVEINSANDAKSSVLLSNNPSNTLNPVVAVKPLQHYHGHLKPHQKVAPCVDKQFDNTNTT
jgi:hypothetical protein